MISPPKRCCWTFCDLHFRVPIYAGSMPILCRIKVDSRPNEWCGLQHDVDVSATSDVALLDTAWRMLGHQCAEAIRVDPFILFCLADENGKRQPVQLSGRIDGCNRIGHANGIAGAGSRCGCLRHRTHKTVPAQWYLSWNHKHCRTMN